jgi:hypothetical protein
LENDASLLEKNKSLHLFEQLPRFTQQRLKLPSPDYSDSA